MTLAPFLRTRIAGRALAVVAVLLCTAANASGQRLKVILDTDIGSDIDDAWALGFAMLSPDIELVGVTITDGDTRARAKMACKLLHLGGRGDVPVAVGRPTPPPDQIDHQFAWAEDFTAKQPLAQSAADFIVEMARRHPGEVTVIAVGPLQNVADALRKDPRLGTALKRVVLMSGSIAASAWGPVPIAEWNVVRSTPDAQVVYAAGLPLTTVPLDATTYVTLKEEERERLRKHDSPLTRALESLYRLWLESPTSRMTLHDQLAVAETVRPGTFFSRKNTLALIVDDKGYTKVDAGRGKPADVCFEPKRDEFMSFYLDGLMRTGRKE
jgi:inosine-uridine nucleoside N-ribohydrolase